MRGDDTMNMVGAIANMTDHLLYLTEINAMITRTEAACDRYRQAADKQGFRPSAARTRRSNFWSMEEMLARLRAERAAAEKAALVASFCARADRFLSMTAAARVGQVAAGSDLAAVDWDC